MSNWEKFRYI